MDLATGESTSTRYERSDYCSVPRAAVVGEAMICIVLAEALLEKLGGDTLNEMKTRFAILREADLNSFEMTNEPIQFWD